MQDQWDGKQGISHITWNLKVPSWYVLQVEDRIGLQLTESMAMWPAAAVSGYYFAHPDSRYFGLGKINHDQLNDYAQRRGITPEEAARWLGPNLFTR